MAAVPIQVVEHRLAEMAVCCEESLAACELAALQLDRGDGDAVALASMAKAKVGRAARYVAHQAVQLHGAMGVTEELAIASYFRRLMAFTQQYGATDWHARVFAPCCTSCWWSTKCVSSSSTRSTTTCCRFSR